MKKVIRIEQRHPETALENLNRVTGLEFESWPTSLLDEDPEAAPHNLSDQDLADGQEGAPAQRPVSNWK